MFYEPDKRNHGLKYNPFKALVVPDQLGGFPQSIPMERQISRPTACSMPWRMTRPA